MSISTNQLAVLRELDRLDREAPAWAGLDDRFWLPYHVVYFYGSGVHGRHAAEPSSAYGLMDVGGARRALLAVHKKGLADRRERRGQSVRYRINDAGREALREA